MVSHSSSDASGCLYIVATPIGNLDDLTKRAADTLKQVDCIAAEDTRHTRKLLNHLGIDKRLFSLHDHNEKDKVEYIESLLMQGQKLALVSDAGTPLISDPGYHVVHQLREKGYQVVPVPGPSALIAALCASGLPTDKFYFAGFLPAKSKARRDVMQSWKDQPGTIVYYESTHRIRDSIGDVLSVYGAGAQLVLGREITKTFETFLSGNAEEILFRFDQDTNQLKGEFVVMLNKGSTDQQTEGLSDETIRILSLLCEELPLKQAAQLAAKITGEKKNPLYKYALEHLGT